MTTTRLGDANDIFAGDAGEDSIYGGAGNDTLRGGGGDDRIFGELGNDYLYGDADDDVMNGGDGTDTVYGGAGADSIGGGLGSDRLDAGADGARDTLSFVVDTASDAGHDVVYNFDDGEDRINLGRFGSPNDLDSDYDGRVTEFDEWAYVADTGDLTIDVGAAFGVDYYEQRLTIVGDTDIPVGDFLFG